MATDPKEWTRAAAELAAGLEMLLEEAASLIMAVDTIKGDDGGNVIVAPADWFDRTNGLLARIRARWAGDSQ